MQLGKTILGLLAIVLEISYCDNKSVAFIVCVFIVLLMVLDKELE